MINPVVTYRIQFHKDFTFRHLDEILPYLSTLRIRTLYASPIFEAVPGSVHGYDVINPHRINPEIGTEEELRFISKRMKELKMMWIQDIVPNHMAFHPLNRWLMDVLEKGRKSIYATYFDLAWTSDLFQGKMMVPVLGTTLEEALKKKAVRVAFDGQRFVIRYFEKAYPVSFLTYPVLLGADPSPDGVRQLAAQISSMQTIEEPKVFTSQWEECCLQLKELCQDPAIKAFITRRVAAFNDDLRLKVLLDQQEYEFTHWQATDHRITYRRFFTVNELIGLNMQEKKVFEDYHSYLKVLIDDGIIQGLRLDHVDGLLDPQQYIVRLRKLAGEEVYIIAEKILQAGERLPDWPIQGTTGYEFLANVNQVATWAGSREKMTRLYHSFTGIRETKLSEEVYAKKSHILYTHMSGELDNLLHLFLHSGLIGNEEFEALPPGQLRTSLGEFLLRCPVYRYYGNQMPLKPAEATAVGDLLESIRRHSPHLEPSVDVLHRVFVRHGPSVDEEYLSTASQFYRRCMQFTGPLMAKGVEDTLFYTYNRFIAHNEVGDSPETFGMRPHEFHASMLERQSCWPLGLNATATHDTKRGEDLRACLSVIPSLADEWEELILQGGKKQLTKDTIPDENDTYFILQSLAGIWPSAKDSTLNSRVEAYLIKALRESKRHSDWTAPNEEYEKSAVALAWSLLKKKTAFSRSLHAFASKIREAGYLHSLVQVILKFTAPGVPDIYQGCERWDFSLVDPDNRRPVDYALRKQFMEDRDLWPVKSPLRTLWQERNNGKVKQWLIHTLCQVRMRSPALFVDGEYIPLETEGVYRDHLLAFARCIEKEWIVTVVPLYPARVAKEQKKKVHQLKWRDTRVLLPPGTPLMWKNILDSGQGQHQGTLLAQELFSSFPLAVIELKSTAEGRSAGLLLPVTSLPSPFHIGDMGPEAFAFVDFLAASRQTWWQLLPLNPTTARDDHSPYSAYSSMAGNPLLISPDNLVEEGLLTDEEVAPHREPSDGRSGYARAEEIKEILLDKAWQRFSNRSDLSEKEGFEQFCLDQSEWLDDFALFSLLRNLFPGKGWTNWPDPYKKRHPQALQEIASSHARAIEKIKWLQFVFDKQWKTLSDHCHQCQVRLMGDIPFYVVHDSADVWAHPELFMLDEEGAITFMAGVPPDYFNADGQLWGMPVYNWTAMRKNGFKWWKQRLKKNMALFDRIRLDHFRAFQDYWQVATPAQNARKGEWVPGPRDGFFTELKKELGTLPFIAEDLGEITESVYGLRDQFSLPGMRVLQFAFGDDMSESPYVPHAHDKLSVVYTGTHDNNTTRGWFVHDLSPKDRKRLSEYTGMRLTPHNIHLALMRIAYGSVAKTVIIPIQDLLGHGAESRMNTPGTASGNWTWRLLKLPEEEHRRQLQRLVALFNRF